MRVRIIIGETELGATRITGMSRTFTILNGDLDEISKNVYEFLLKDNYIFARNKEI